MVCKMLQPVVNTGQIAKMQSLWQQGVGGGNGGSRLDPWIRKDPFFGGSVVTSVTKQLVISWGLPVCHRIVFKTRRQVEYAILQLPRCLFNAQWSCFPFPSAGFFRILIPVDRQRVKFNILLIPASVLLVWRTPVGLFILFLLAASGDISRPGWGKNNGKFPLPTCSFF